MLIGDLNKLDDSFGLPPIIKTVCKYLATLNFQDLVVGKYMIDGQKNIFMLVNIGETAPANSKQAEIHHEFTDLQLLIQGTEKIEYNINPPILTEYTPYQQEQDIQFQINHNSTQQTNNFIILNAMMFAVFFPYEAHKPMCSPTDEQSQLVKKIVVKIPKQLLVG